MLTMSINVMGQYNPANPAEPGAAYRSYTLELAADPVGGGTFSIAATSQQTEGTTFWVQANVAANFQFVNWTEDGEVTSTTARFQYTMPSHNAKLTAHYLYAPGNPGEPAQAVIPEKPVYAPLYLTASPAAGGSFSIASGNSYEVGKAVSVRANPASNFRFVNWTDATGAEVSTSATYSYTMLSADEGNSLTANFSYEPGNPAEPVQRLYHKVFLLSSPAGGGTFNVASGNEYEEGTNQTFRANPSQWYAFVNWTDEDGNVVSTNANYTLTMPTEDLTLTANFIYNYNPANPAEPASVTTAAANVYGMTVNAVAGQTVSYPVYMENTSEIGNMTVVLTFPEGFSAQPDGAALAERATGKNLSVTPLEGNAYRFDITGGTAITSANGKLFEVPVVVSAEAETDQTYAVSVTNAAKINADESKVMLNKRDGYIYVEQMREDGLYASFTFDKLQNRIKFNNQSSDKALDWTWNFGDGTSSIERDPMHIYASPGYYDVTLTVRGETGTDMSMMTVYVNERASWRVDGTLFLDTEQKGVRYFTSLGSLLEFMSASPIASDVTVMVKEGETFGSPLTSEEITQLTTIKNRLADNGYTLTLRRNGTATGETTVGFGTDGEVISTEVAELFAALGQNLQLDGVMLKLWGIRFDPTQIDGAGEQTVRSGEATTEVDFTMISPDLTFTWTAVGAFEMLSGYEPEGTGNIGTMTIVSESAADEQIMYNVVGKKGDETFCEFTHTITVKPVLSGEFTQLSPANDSKVESTTVTLTWNSIQNAVYDVYLWNAANQRPATPLAEGITTLSVTSSNFLQNNKLYKWQVVARNATQQIESDVQSFTVKMLPDLHVTAVSVDGSLEAGKSAVIRWTVRNDGNGDTDADWKDRLWLVPDVYGGTNQTNCVLLTTKANVKTLAAGEEYEGMAEVTLTEEQYGNYYLLVAADMNSVTGIEWGSVGGSIVNPYAPVAHPTLVDEYAYLYATTSGSQVEESGEIATHSDNFFYLKATIDMPQMTDEDWELLQAAYAEMGNGEGWTNKWDFTPERHTVETLPGVSILGGHVVSINLSNNGLTGNFPYTLLSLPNLETLNISENQLTGELSTEFTAEGSQLRALNISSNQLEGNIGAFAQKLAALKTLYAADNKLTDVSPALSEDISTVTLDRQTMDAEVTVYADHLSAADVWAQIPSMLLYDPLTRTYATELSLLCEDGGSGFSTVLTVNEDDIQTLIPQPSTLIPITMTAKALGGSDTPTGSSLKVKFAYLYPRLSLADDEDNTLAIATAAEAATPYNVTLAGRTIYGDGAWNSLCLPFSIADISQTPLSGMDVRELVSAEVEDVSLKLTFAKDITSIEAGKPYIVRFTGSDVVEPEFQGVTLTTADNSFTGTDGDVTFKGTFAPVEISAEGDATKLYINSGNRLSWPNGAMTIGAQRAYFQLNNDLVAVEDDAAGAKSIISFYIDYGDGEIVDYTTGVEIIHNAEFIIQNNSWHTLDGRRLSGKPSKGGMYIYKGKKLIIK